LYLASFISSMGFLAVIFVYQLVLLWFEVKQAVSLGPRHHFG